MQPVSTKADLDIFITMPRAIYRDDPCWVEPLIIERRMHLTPGKNPFFEHARWQAWIAFRGDQPVGRISAQIDDLHIERYNDATGFFGMIEAEDQQETFALLLSTAEQWLKNQGMTRVSGPFNLGINEEMGLLIDGFETPPVFMMGHARPYYGERLEQCGYQKAKDTLAYSVAPDFSAPPVMQRLLKTSKHKISTRSLNMKHLDDEMAILRDIFNDAWVDNWNYVPFTDAEFKDLGQNLRYLVNPDFIQIAEVDGEPVAFIVVLPNINEAIHGLKGKLFPFGWLKLLWRLKVRYPDTARVPLMGVRQKFQQTRLGPALAFLVIAEVRKHVVQRGASMIELSWILEDNAGMRSILKSIGSHVYKRYRIYERLLDKPE